MQRRFIVVILFFLFSSQAQGLSLCVKSSKANLRSEPNSKSKITWTVGSFMPLLRIDTKDRWSQVKDVDGETHWIFTSLLTQKIRCLVIKVSKANLRTGPGVNFPRANYRTAGRYESFRRLEKKGNWHHIESDFGERAWVHEQSVWTAKRVIKFTY